MIRVEFVISSPEGMHARPAAELVRVVTTSGLDVTIGRVNQAKVPANSMLSIMSLGLHQGERVQLEVAADDASPLLAQLTAIF